METYFVRFPNHDTPESRGVIALGIAAITITLVFLGYSMWLPAGVVARNVWIEGIPLGNQHSVKIPQHLSTQRDQLGSPLVTITLTDSDTTQTWSKTSHDLGIEWEYEQITQAALRVGRTGPWWQQAADRLSGWWSPQQLTPHYTYRSDAVTSWLKEVSTDVNQAGRAPQAMIAAGTVTIDAGEQGRELDTTELQKQLLAQAGLETTIELPIESTHVPLSADANIAAQLRAESLAKTVVVLTTKIPNDPVIRLEASEFFPWLALPTGFHTTNMTEDLTSLTEPFNREARDAVFTIDQPSNEITEFAPHLTGRAVEIDQLIPLLQARLTNPTEPSTPEDTELLVPLKETDPAVTLESTNDLGIKERIGVGYSTYLHSIPNRVHNVALTSERVHATLIPAGESFSFNQAVGTINQSTGYKTAYVIRNGRTELGDGGGVCQVSTTVFRAALNAGLPITQWKPHSYRVGYYEQNMEPGFDATIYSPSTDLKFMNDTGHAIVLATESDVANRELTIELWGTSDGRTAEIHSYRMWNQRGAPAAKYIDDPSLPKGTLKQIDWAAPGASAEFTYTVKNADGSLRNERKFTSHFRPWQAIFLVGTRE